MAGIRLLGLGQLRRQGWEVAKLPSPLQIGEAKISVDSSDTRRAALALLRSGEANPAEVARLAGVSRQAASMWAKLAGIDWMKLRRARIAKLWAAQLRRH